MAKGPVYDVGLHVGEVMAQDIQKAGTGNTVLVLKVKILGIPEGDTYKPHRAQYERTIYWTATEKTVEFIKEKFERIDFNGSPSQWSPHHPQHISLKGNQVDLWCSHEQGRQPGDGMRERWDIARGESDNTPSDPLPARDTRALDALFGKTKATPPPVTPQRVQQAVEPQQIMPEDKKYDFGFQGLPADDDGTQITDDDIPF